MAIMVNMATEEAYLTFGVEGCGEGRGERRRRGKGIGLLWEFENV